MIRLPTWGWTYLTFGWQGFLRGSKAFKPGLCWKGDIQGNRKFIVPINSSQCNDAGFFPRRHLSEAWGKKRGGRALIRRKVVEGRRESLGRAAWPQAHPSNSQLHPSSIRATFLLSFHLQLAMSSSSICYYQLPPRRVPSSPTVTRHLPTLHLLPSVFFQRTHFATSNLQPLEERAPQSIDCIIVMVSPQVHRLDETQLDHQTSCAQPLLW